MKPKSFSHFFEEFKGCVRSRRKATAIIIDFVAIEVDANRKRSGPKAARRETEYRWIYSTSQGHLLGFKLAVAMETCTKRIIGFKIYIDARNDAPALREFLDELKAKDKIRFGDIIVTDRGPTCFLNYLYALNVVNVVPILQPRRNVSPSNVLNQVSPLLEASVRRGVLLERWLQLYHKLRELLPNFQAFSALRIEVERCFLITKEGFGLRKIHRYTKRSTLRISVLCIMLAAWAYNYCENQKYNILKLLY